jgi:hypothetical protein
VCLAPRAKNFHTPPPQYYNHASSQFKLYLRTREATTVHDESGADYVPHPIDTSHVKLGDDLLGLSETLARNNHDVWARERLRDGWRYGAARNDERKEHPSLIPYEALTESEKKYDLNTVLETLKATAALGYRIERSAHADGDAGRSEGDD